MQKARRSAVQMAVAEVSDYLGIQASVRFEQKKTELVTKALKEITTASRARVESSRMSEMYYEQYRDVIDGKVVATYDVYVLLRLPFVEIEEEKERQKKELEDALIQVKKIVAEGDRSRQEGKLILAFQKWFIALEIVEDLALGSSIKYEIISKVKDGINRVNMSFIDDTAGDAKKTPDERGEDGSAPEFPVKLSLQVEFSDGEKDIPLKNIPIRFHFLTGQGTLDRLAVSDSHGRAYCDVYTISPWPKKIMIESRLVPENILPASSKLSSELMRGIRELIESRRAIYIFPASAIAPDMKRAPLLAPEPEEAVPELFPGKDFISVDIKPSNKYVLSSNEERLFLCVKIDLQGTGVVNLSRPLLNISLVLDRSASMEEAKKIEYTKEAAGALIDNLTENDFLSIVAYDTDTEIISAAAPVTQKNLLKHKIGQVFAGGTTNLSGGLSEGYEQVLKNRKENFVNRIILLSDGVANVGVTDERSLLSLAKKYRKQGISITTLGVGTDFNEDLMIGLAEYGAGNYYFIRNPEKIPEMLQRELKQLLAVIAQNIRVEIYPKSGVEVVGTYDGGYGQEKIRDGGVRFSLGDISFGDRKIMIIELKLSEQKKGKRDVVNIKITYDDVLTGRGRVEEEKDISVTYTDNAGLVKSSEDEEVNKYIRISCAAEMMHKAMKTLDAGLYRQTIDMLRKEHESIAEYARIHSDNWLAEKAEIFKHCADQLARMEKSGELHDRDSMKGMRKELHYQGMMMRHHK